MKLKNIQAMISAICLCACIAFTGCSERVNTPNEMPSGDQSVESSDDSSSESSEASSDYTQSESESSSSQASSNNEYLEIRLDHEYLETVEKDVFNVTINLHIDTEALKNEYNEKYPKLTENNYYWVKFLYDRNEQIIKEFLSDHGIACEDREIYTLSVIRDEFDKSVLSSMLDDPRVAGIIYYPGDHPLSNLHH